MSNDERILAEMTIEFLKKTHLFGDILSSLLRKKGISQVRLADKISVDATAVSNWSRGTRLPNGAILYSIATALSLNADEKEVFFYAWDYTKKMNSLLDYAKEAFKAQDYAHIIYLVKKQLADGRDVLLQFSDTSL